MVLWKSTRRATGAAREGDAPTRAAGRPDDPRAGSRARRPPRRAARPDPGRCAAPPRPPARRGRRRGPRAARVYGTRGRGRPAKVFALTEAGRDQFDQQYDDLAVQALRFIAETGGDEAVPRSPAPGRRLEAHYDARSSTRSPDGSRPEALAGRSPRRLRRLGPRGPGRRAAVPAALPGRARGPRVPPAVRGRDRGHLPVLGRHVQRLATIAHGDGVCTTCIPTARPESDPEKSPTDDEPTQPIER